MPSVAPRNVKLIWISYKLQFRPLFEIMENLLNKIFCCFKSYLERNYDAILIKFVYIWLGRLIRKDVIFCTWFGTPERYDFIAIQRWNSSGQFIDFKSLASSLFISFDSAQRIKCATNEGTGRCYANLKRIFWGKLAIFVLILVKNLKEKGSKNDTFCWWKLERESYSDFRWSLQHIRGSISPDLESRRSCNLQWHHWISGLRWEKQWKFQVRFEKSSGNFLMIFQPFGREVKLEILCLNDSHRLEPH